MQAFPFLRPGNWPIRLKVLVFASLMGGPTAYAIESFSDHTTPSDRAEFMLLVAVATIGFLLGLLGLLRLGSRLAALARAAEEVKASGHERLPAQSSDEVGRLARVLNRMIERVQETNADLVRLVGEHMESLELQRSVLDNAGEYAIVSDDQLGRILFANAGAATLLGLADPSDALGKSFLSLLESGPAERAFLASVSSPAEVGGATSALVRIRREDGTVFPASVRAATRLDRRGAPAGRVYVFKDSSRELRAERRYRELFFSLQEAVYVTNREGEFLEANEAMARLLGLGSVEEVRGHRATELYEDVSDRNAWVEALERSGEIRHNEVRIRNRNGEVRLCIESSRAIRGPDGKVECYLGTLVDITERRRLQDRLEQAKRIEAIGTMAGGLAHDFNNILAAVVPNAELIERSAGAPADVRERGRTIRLAAERASALTRQLLSFSRKEREKRTAVSLNQVVLEAVRLLQPAMPERVALETRLADCEPLVVGDATSLHQVIVNLVLNARDAVAEKGRVVLSTHATVLGEEFCRGREGLEPGSYAVVSVEDDGCGMNREQMERIFDPFYTTKSKGGGTGLGLSVVYSIVGASGGHVEVRSAPGQGARFDVFLPEAVREQPEGLRFRKLSLGETRVALVADDDPIAKRRLTEAIESNGWRVIGTAGPGGAADLLRRSPGEYSILLLDASMAIAGGGALVRELRAIDPAARIVLVGGAALRDEAVRLEGVAGYLEKPIDAEGLRRALGEPTPLAASGG